ncbi:MAG: hypothetical protein EBZ59_07185 [Planctomycetia bacterium]|nr:hypothetical protein [Planctomycetia bacterium]
MTHRQMRMMQDWIPAIASLVAILGTAVAAAMSFQRVDSLTQQIADDNRKQDAAIEEIRSETSHYLQSIDRRLSNIEGRFEQQKMEKR